MKKVLIPVILAAAFVLIFSGCPELLEDPMDSVIVFDGELDMQAWLGLLQDIDKKVSPINLDLRKATYVTGNERGGLIEFTLSEGLTSQTYIAFDPYPLITTGKRRIVSIILPDEATMILPAVESAGKDERDADPKLLNPADVKKLNSAFRHFSRLKSVSASNVLLIGNYAFTELTSLETVNFPMVGHVVTPAEFEDTDNTMASGFRVDIGHYAFWGCTGLKEAIFNNAAVIGRSAFKGCTDIEKISFPKVWMVGQNAFEGNTSLTEIRFESATKIGDSAFEGCSSLKRVFLTADPEQTTAVIPVDDGVPTINYGSMMINPYAFAGCRSLEMIDVQRAWNVYFATGALENIGEKLDLYLFDDDGTKGTGHPQIEMFLGVLGDKPTVSLKEIDIYVPIAPSSGQIKDNFEQFIQNKYSKVKESVIHGKPPTP